jgi:hypothetical protein
MICVSIFDSNCAFCSWFGGGIIKFNPLLTKYPSVPAEINVAMIVASGSIYNDLRLLVEK